MRRPAAWMLVLVGVTLLAGPVPVAAPAAVRVGLQAGLQVGLQDGLRAGNRPAAGPRVALGMAHSCLIDAGPGITGQVRCFGYGYPDRTAPPIDLGPGRRAAALVAGDFHTCALLGPDGPDAGAVRCWGDNIAGQLGLGHRADGASAVDLVDLRPGRTARALAAGSNFTCALLDDRAVRCWAATAPVNSAPATRTRSAPPTARRRTRRCGSASGAPPPRSTPASGRPARSWTPEPCGAGATGARGARARPRRDHRRRRGPDQ